MEFKFPLREYLFFLLKHDEKMRNTFASNCPLDAPKENETRTELETHRRGVLGQHAHPIDA
jgi:hypothetical protein